MFSTIEIHPILAVLSKKALYGAPVQLNYVPIGLRVPSFVCIPSSRMLSKIAELSVFERVQETLILQVITERLITDDTVAIVATHIEARDQAPMKEKKTKQTEKAWT